MAIFGRSKKSKQTVSQHPDPLAYPYSSQVALQGPYGSASQVGWPNDQNFSQSTPQFQASALWLAPQNQPINITQNLFLAPPLPERPQKYGNAITKLNLSSMSNLLDQGVSQYVPGANYIKDVGQASTQYFNQQTALCDLISSKFDSVITLIDGDKFSGDENELAVHETRQPKWPQHQESDRALTKGGKSNGMINDSVSNALTSANYFAKVNLYANSRLPPNLPPMKLYVAFVHPFKSKCLTQL